MHKDLVADIDFFKVIFLLFVIFEKGKPDRFIAFIGPYLR